MTLLRRIKGFVAGLMVLAAVCLVVEQLAYIFLVPGYFWELSVSPVVWGLFSAVCFYLLWRFDQKYPNVKNSTNSGAEYGWKVDWRGNWKPAWWPDWKRYPTG